MPLPRGLINSLNRNHPLVGYRRQLAAVLLDPVERWVACATSNSQFRLKTLTSRAAAGVSGLLPRIEHDTTRRR